jgi:hypothetical protein
MLGEAGYRVELFFRAWFFVDAFRFEFFEHPGDSGFERTVVALLFSPLSRRK